MPAEPADILEKLTAIQGDLNDLVILCKRVQSYEADGDLSLSAAQRTRLLSRYAALRDSLKANAAKLP